MEQTTKRFLLIDDDPISIFISIMVLEDALGKIQVDEFSIPEDGLEFIKHRKNDDPESGQIVLFLDINMPSMSGWEFLEAFELFDATIKDRYDIYILSSSVNAKDINLAKANPRVVDFVEKPLISASLRKIFG
ncbi:CheY-like chemotaxis protein [Pedobacter sp. UYEF25]